MVDQPEGEPRLKILAREECLRILANQMVGRIGISSQVLPVILPVNFGLINESIVFRTKPGTKLDAATNNTVVAFEVDDYDEIEQSGWSVLAIGVASKMSGDKIASAEALGFDAWPLDGQASHFVRIDISQLTGRRSGRLP